MVAEARIDDRARERQRRDDGRSCHQEAHREEEWRRRARTAGMSDHGTPTADTRAAETRDCRKLPRPADDTKNPPAGRARWASMGTLNDPPFRPHGTGTPASRDRPSRTATAYHGPPARRSSARRLPDGGQQASHLRDGGSRSDDGTPERSDGRGHGAKQDGPSSAIRSRRVLVPGRYASRVSQCQSIVPTSGVPGSTTTGPVLASFGGPL